nr:hypothetical protein [uncultured Bacteroides sp.]
MERKLLELNELVEKIKRRREDNEFFLNNDTFLKTQILADGTTIEGIITLQNKIPRDLINLFFTIFKVCKKNKLSFEDLISYLSLEDEDNCTALIALNYIEELPKNRQVLINYKSWLQFRRYYLGKYPKSPEYFLSECEKYFENLKIHPDNVRHLKDVLYSHSKKIICYLGCLNDSFAAEFKNSHKDLIHFMKIFAGNHNLDGASFEGTKKDCFKFIFPKEDSTEEVYCEPHLKIYRDDCGNVDQHCRIYFKNEQNIIFVGFIGKHL